MTLDEREKLRILLNDEKALVGVLSSEGAIQPFSEIISPLVRQSLKVVYDRVAKEIADLLDEPVSEEAPNEKEAA